MASRCNLLFGGTARSAAVLITFAVLVTGCASLPPPKNRLETVALTDSAGTRLGRAIAPSVATHPGKTGIYRLADPRDAFAARVLLASAAEKSLDVQYFIWHGDHVGYLLFQALWQAAERGVRVRLLLDDLNTKGLDPTIATLDAHPNIEVRLYNPVVNRDNRLLNFVTEFSRVNRRMHNKSFTADNQATVVGGRNIADEYFGAGTGLTFADLDVLAAGPAVPEVSKEFDVYWNSASAYPASGFVGPSTADGIAQLEAKFAATRADPESISYLETIRTMPLMRDLLDRKLALEWAATEVVYDDPAKTLDTEGRKDVLLFPELMRKMGRPEKQLDIVSPYFVPGDGGTELLASVAKRGVTVRILTNSLAASDEKSVHSGYAKRRRQLLQAGVRLYEIKPTATNEQSESNRRFGSGSSSGLHAKTLAVDSQRIFVGSFNFDQRSAHLNTEMGMVLSNPLLAQGLTRFFDVEVLMLAYEVRLAADGRMEWIERTAAGEKHYDVDPVTSWSTRMGVELLSILPVEWLL